MSLETLGVRMCDFRNIKEITFLRVGVDIPIELLGQTLDVSDHLRARMHTFPHDGVPYITEVTEPGFYFIEASGSGYGYFTGSRWLGEGEHYEVTKFEEHRCV